MEKTGKSYSDETILEIMQKAKNGSYLQDLEKEYGVSYSTVLNWCKKLLINPMKRPRGKRHDWDAIKAKLK